MHSEDAYIGSEEGEDTFVWAGKLLGGGSRYKRRCIWVFQNTYYHGIPSTPVINFVTVRDSRNNTESWDIIFVTAHHEVSEPKLKSNFGNHSTFFVDKYLIVTHIQQGNFRTRNP